MKKALNTFLKSLFTIALLVIITMNVIAQKLPNVQTASLRAPANIKIDGRANEWGNKFQAYNHSTDVSYTIANNDTFLYLTIQATDPDNINKIYNGGLTFTIDKSNKKIDNGSLAITYPVYDPEDKFHVSISHKPIIDLTSPASVAKADSFMNANNKLMSAKAKYIKTSGIKGVDTLISVYNEDGIKAAARFDNQMVYTIEIAIDLKLLGLSVNNTSMFSYHILLSALRSYKNWDNVAVTQVQASDGRMVPNINLGSRGINQIRAMASPTDFWGEYTLAIK